MSVRTGAVFGIGLLLSLMIGCEDRSAVSPATPVPVVAPVPAPTPPVPAPTRDPNELTLAAADELIARAKREASDGNLLFANAKVARVLAQWPEHPQALRLQSMLLLQHHPDTPIGLARLNRRERLQKLEEWYARITAAGDSAEFDEAEQTQLRAGLYEMAMILASYGEDEQAVARLQEANRVLPLSPSQLEGEILFDFIRERAGFRAMMADLWQQQIAQTLLAMEPFERFTFSSVGEDITGKPLDLADMRGQVVLVYWGSAHSLPLFPLNREIPTLVKLHDKYHQQGVEIVGYHLPLGDKETADREAREFIAQHKIPYRIAYPSADWRRQLPVYAEEPIHLFIDRQGNVRMMLGGVQTFEMLAAIVDRLSQEPAPSPNK